jgi:hypothetical protein
MRRGGGRPRRRHEGGKPAAALWGSGAAEGALRILFGGGVRAASGDSLTPLELACGTGGSQARKLLCAASDGFQG